MEMETYKKVAIVTGIIGFLVTAIIAGLISGDAKSAVEVENELALTLVGFGMIFYIIGTIILVAIPIQKHKSSGWIAIALGLVFGWLLIIPGIMAVRYKPNIINGTISR